MRFEQVDMDYWKFYNNARVYDYKFYTVTKKSGGGSGKSKVHRNKFVFNTKKYRGFNVFEPFYIFRKGVRIRAETKASRNSEKTWRNGNLIGSLTVEKGYSEQVRKELSDIVGKELTPSRPS